MATLHDARCEIDRYAVERGIRTDISGVYDLFPNQPRATAEEVSYSWPARWPNGSRRGVYLFFSDSQVGLELRYVGKTSGRTMRLSKRLDQYVDMKAFRQTGACILRSEWNGRYTPWTGPIRYVVTVALPDSESGTCPEAERLEPHLICVLQPVENVR
jgi:hypothetical protein